MPDDFNIKHPFYMKTQPIRGKARDLHAGSEVIKQAGHEYLFPTQNEKDNQYKIRLKRAVYDNWPKVVIDTRQSLTWKNAVQRENFGELEQFILDVDGFGTTADAFFRMVTESASVSGLDFVLVDKTPLRSDRELSRQEETEAGIRPKFIHIPGENVFDWQFGQDQKLEWVVIRAIDAPKRLPGESVETTELRIVWTRTEIKTYEQAKKDKLGSQASAKAKWNLRSTQPNQLGSIPLVPVYGFRLAEFFGVSVIKDILDHAISIYNKFSDRDWFEFLSNSPVTTIIAGEKPDMVNVGSNQGIFIPSTQGNKWEVAYLEPTGKGAESSRDSERDLIRRIFEIALRQSRRDTAQIQSFRSQQEEAKIFRSSLVAVTEEFEQSEQRCWELAAQWEGIDDWQGEVIYNRDFDDKMIEASMIEAFSRVTERNQLSRETLLTLLQKGEILPEDLDLIAEINRIRQDQDDLAFPGTGNPNNEEEEETNEEEEETN